MKNKLIKFLELLLIVIIVSVCIFSIFDSSILDNRIYFIILLIVPFLLLFIIELIKIVKELKLKSTNKEIELEEAEELDSNIELNEKIKEIIDDTTQEKIEIKDEVQDQTIQIPVKEIKSQIESLNQKLTKEEEIDLEKTEILFNKEEIKEIIKKELESTTSVDKNKKNNKKSTETVENSDKSNNKSTDSVEK